MKGINLFAILLLSVSCSTQKAFNIAVMPDTQVYSRYYPEIFYSQTDWIYKHRDQIAFVLHEGDITTRNWDDQWQVAQKAMTKLDGQVPYVLCMGNHDIGTDGSADVRNTDKFNQYFPYDKYSRMNGFGGAYAVGEMDNTWYTFNVGGIKWLVVSLEFGPRNSVLEWANKIVSDHPKHRVILLTHAYLYNDDTHMSAERHHQWLARNYGVGKTAGEDTVNDGQEIWDKLVKRHANMRFVFNGHVLGDGTGKLVSTGEHGNKVYQMLANYQTGVDNSENGGNGFLRLVSFDIKRKTITVKTYSPYLDAYKTEPDQEFIFDHVEF
ncbi:metallophosphoesterase [Parapedobacter koreensis]|uniref:Calcineurin-like phosphoesterase n=1 Tax=Parapedobacter koreensis TaxID=332977 RepID=A0A1H7FP73_9SPHI|nr:metallophosphoesterase [Parapedobacter koreensis]SEK27893.1 Calcineurin-like phosphoesterase [Parapedobacter koreensis]